MKKLKQFLSYMKARYNRLSKRHAEDRACEVFQVTEYKHNLWFVCNGTLLCPCDYICESSTDGVAILSFLTKVRALYIERNT